jgi:nicotinamide mononucleotide transporter
MSTILFTAWGYDVLILELVAAITSFIGVWLGTTGKRITWPWWALSSALYGVFFYQVEYYASAVLQIVFIAAALYGWKDWAPTGAVAGNLTVRNRTYIALGTFISVAALSPLLSNIGAAATWSDAFVLIGSLVAQVMMVYEKYESWIVWMVVDVVATIQYAVNELYFTAILYAMFTVIAVIGWKRWRDSLSY